MSKITKAYTICSLINPLKLIFLLSLYLSPVLGHTQEKIAYGNNPAAGKYITLNGVKHYYEAYGSGPAMLLIHGNKTATAGWAAQIEHFSKRYRVYSVDCRGRGKSALGKDSLTYRQMADDMAAFIKNLKLDSVIVIGKSDGAIVALLMGMYHPGHLGRIVAFAANMQPDTNALYSQTVTEVISERIKADKMLAAKDTTKDWLVEQQRYRMMEYQPHISGADLQRVNIPVLVISSDRDLIRLEHTLWIYKNLRFANLCILNGETHSVLKVNPSRFNSAVDYFLDRSFKGDELRFE